MIVRQTLLVSGAPIELDVRLLAAALIALAICRGYRW